MYCLINSRSQAVRERLDALSPDDVALCDVVKYELDYGAYKSSKREKNLETLREFFSEFISLPFDSKAATICGYIREERALCTPIGAYDLQKGFGCFGSGGVRIWYHY